MGAPEGFWECPKCGDYVEQLKTTCPHCGSGPQSLLEARYRRRSIPTSSSSSTSSSSTTKSAETYTIAPVYSRTDSASAIFLKALAFVLWIGGLIVSIAGSNVVTGVDRWGDATTSFSFIAFITTFIIYGVAGGFMYCMADVVQDIKDIADSLRGFKAKKDDGV